MLEKKKSIGYFIAVDGPNGVGKSTLIAAIKNKLEILGYDVYVTREPTDTKLGNFLREFAEQHSGVSLACMVAADRYEHVPIHHPSYIYVYRRKRIDEYINEVERIIKRLL